MNALERILQKLSDDLSPLEYAIWRLWMTAQNNNPKGDGNQKTIHDVYRAVEELESLRRQLAEFEAFSTYDETTGECLAGCGGDSIGGHTDDCPLVKWERVIAALRGETA